ncbi:MAG: PTS sugar transporter subunit IIA [Planctomycetia bacterium]|nr:MAG: PTS sugar transporter subunit IIA [Planctomycetia bacterium]
MELSRILTLDRILMPMQVRDKFDAITQLIDLLATRGALQNRDAALAAVLKRESDATTGIGCGLAIPHAKSDGTKSLVLAAGKPAAPIDFLSHDGQPVFLIMLLVSPPDHTGPHIRTLAQIARLMNASGFRQAAEQAGTAEELHAAIARYEQAEA